MAELMGICDICWTPPATTRSLTPAITRLGREVDGLLGRAALAVDGGAGDVLGAAGHQPAGAGDVAGLAADGVDVAEHHVLDRAGVDAGAVEQGPDRVGPQVGRVDLAQAAAPLAHGGPDGVDDVGLGHGCSWSREVPHAT